MIISLKSECLPQLPADNDAMPEFLLRSSHVNPTPHKIIHQMIEYVLYCLC